jgi:hypothetical protein
MSLKIFGNHSPKKLYEYELKSGGLKNTEQVTQYFQDNYTRKIFENPGRISELKIGEIYHYRYDPKTKDILAYYDTNPLTLIYNGWFSQDGTYLYTGINLHFLPSQIKLIILESYWQYFYRFSGNKIMKFLPISYNDFFKFLFKKLQGMDYSFAIRTYISTRLDSPVIIPNNEWGKIPLVKPMFMNGATLEQVYADYYKSLKPKK